MNIFVNNLPEYRREIKRIAEKVIEKEGLSGELSITFVGDEEMIGLNSKYTERKETTDVLAFSFDIPELLGDIYISIELAKKQKQGSLLSELKILVIHGILHLAGYDDVTLEDRKKMSRKEKEYFLL